MEYPFFHSSIIPIVTCPLAPSNGSRGEANEVAKVLFEAIKPPKTHL